MANVLITGCNSGFGYYTTECFAKAGHRVFSTVRPEEDMTGIEALAATEGHSIKILSLDVTDSDQIAAVRDEVLAEGPLDVLVNNAGRVVIAPFEETPEDHIRAIFDVNVFGLVNMTQAFLPSMRENGRPVAEAILDAVFDGTQNLHYPVGPDSQMIFDNRASL